MQWHCNFLFEATSIQKKRRKLSHFAWKGINDSLCKARDQNMCLGEAMTAFRKPWPGLSGMLNAIHPQGYLWRQSPFGICFIFLNACIKSAERKRWRWLFSPNALARFLSPPPMHAVWCLYTLLCLQWMPAIWWIRTSQRAFSARTGIRQRYSKPGANTKHLNVKSVISIPKSLNIEIRSSVQQRPIFTLIYHSCPCTQGLITPYMVNKPLACTRQYDVHTKTMYLLYSNSSSSGLHLDHAIIQKCTAQNRMGTCTLDYFDARGHLERNRGAFIFKFFNQNQFTSVIFICWKLCRINKQRPRLPLAG